MDDEEIAREIDWLANRDGLSDSAAPYVVLDILRALYERIQALERTGLARQALDAQLKQLERIENLSIAGPKDRNP